MRARRCSLGTGESPHQRVLRQVVGIGLDIPTAPHDTAQEWQLVRGLLGKTRR